MRILKTLALALLLGSAGSLAAKAETYAFDASHTEISFRISHWSVNKVRGFFKAFDGSISYDAAKPEKSSVSVTIDPKSIDTRNEMRDDDLRGEKFFDTAKFPEARFKSKKVSKGAAAGQLLISGDLTIRGVSKPVVLETTLTDTLVDGMGKTRFGFEARTKINRKDFGIAWNMASKTGTFMLGDEVEIEINGEAVKK